MNILKSMETTLDRANQYHWMLYYLLVAFFIFLAARWFHIDSSYVNAITPPKKIGLYSSVNWAITFIILFPFFVFLACSTASNNLALWHDLAGNRIVTGPEGIRTTSDSLLSTWAERLKTSNIVVIAFVAISAITAMTDYWDSAGGPPPILLLSLHGLYFSVFFPDRLGYRTDTKQGLRQ